MSVTLLLAAACKHGPATPVPTPPTPPGSASTADTGPRYPAWTTDFELPPLPDGFDVEPSVRVVGFPGLDLGLARGVVLPAGNGDPGVIYAATSASVFPELGLPLSMGFSGVLPRGVHRVFEVWDGATGYDGHAQFEVASTGDVNGDGHLDAWFATSLYHGPLLGRRVPRWSPEGAGAFIDESNGYTATRETPMAGVYDADGDGSLDVVMGFPTQTAYTYYGPLEGTIPWIVSPTADRSRYTSFGIEACPGDPQPTLLRDHLGPGHHAFATGLCSTFPMGYVFDLMQPPGEAVSFDEAIARVGEIAAYATTYWDPGDVDVDGFGDFFLGMWGGGGLLYRGPVSGDLKDRPQDFEQRGGDIIQPAGDLDGDGTTEFLAWDWIQGIWILAFSPYPDQVIDFTTGLRLGRVDVFPDYPVGFVDIDGDAIPDLVTNADPSAGPPPEAMGEIRIWYGTDLLAAAGRARRTP